MENRLVLEDEFFVSRDLTYSYDSLTKIFNREITFEYIEYLISKNIPFSMIICDADNFKYVNDTYGHIVGDKVLVKLSKNFKKLVKEYGIVGRFGGDEFIIVVPEVVEYDSIWSICKDINFTTNDLKMGELHGASMTLTLGMARFPLDGKSVKEIMDKADKALYRGKQKGRNCFIIYLPEKHANIDIGDSSKVKFNSIEMHYKIFGMLTHGDDLEENIVTLMHFLSSTLMIDHLCIQTNDKLLSTVVYPLSPVKSFGVVPVDIVRPQINNNGLGFINQTRYLLDLDQKELFECLSQQMIGGFVIVQIEAYGKVYGYLRADTANQNGRIWQNSDLDLLVVFAKTLGLLLHYNEIDLEELFG